MNRLVILVDAGYLCRQAVEILSAKASHSRADLKLTDANGLINMLVNAAVNELNNNQLLRVYWYDGVKDNLSPEHRAIIAVNDVQLRAGTINGSGQQKGVDSKIVTDLVELASNHAISDAMLVTGDGDLAIGIELAQRRGVRVATLGVGDMSVGVHHQQSSEVTNLADRVIHITAAELTPYMAYSPRGVTTTAAAPSSSIAGSTPMPLAEAVTSFVTAQTPQLTAAVIGPTGSIDPVVDKALLYHVYLNLHQGALTEPLKRQARAELRRQLQAPAAPVTHP